MTRIDWPVRGVQIAALAAALGLWLAVGRAQWVSPIFLPPLEEVVTEIIEMIVNGGVFAPLAVTLQEMLVAYGLSAGFGLTLGYGIGRSCYATAVFEPLLAGIFAVPIVIFLPLFILLLGIGPESKMAFGASYGFFPIVLNTIAGIAQVDPRFVTVARSMGATDAQLFRRVIAPAALPVILTGIRIGFIIGFLAIIGSEMVAGLDGLGSRIVRLAEGMNTAEMFAHIVFVVLIAAMLNAVLSAIQTRHRQPGTASA